MLKRFLAILLLAELPVRSLSYNIQPLRELPLVSSIHHKYTNHYCAPSTETERVEGYS